MNFDDFNNSQRNSSTLNFDDNDLLDDEWLYTSEPFDRTNTFRRKVKNEGETRNSILEWLATDDDKVDSQDGSSINLEEINNNNKRRTKDSINLFDNDPNNFNTDSLFDDDLDISNLDSKFMSNFKLVSQDDFEDTEIEESLTKTSTSPEIHRCDSPNTEIDLETHKIGNNETINIEDNDSDSNMTIINTTNKSKIENNLEEDKKTEIINIDDNNINDINTTELNLTKSSLLKKSELAQKRFLAKVEEAKRTLENLKPRKDSMSSENDIKIKTPKLEENENQNDNKKNETHNKKKLERRSYYYYADTGSDDEKEDNKSSPLKMNQSNDIYSSSFKKTFNHFNSGAADTSLYSDSIYNTNENLSLPPFHSNKLSDDLEDYPRKPPAPAIPNNTNMINNLMDHANFESQPAYQSDIETESSSSFHSDHQLPEYYGNQHFSHYNPPPMNNNTSFYSSSPNSKPNNLYIPSSPSLKSSFFAPTSPSIKPSTSFIPSSPSLKSSTSFIPNSPSLKPNTSFIPTSPGLKPKKINTSFIPTSPSLKPTNSHIPSSPTISKYSSSSTSSLYNKQISHIASPRMGYSSPSSPTPYSKSYESRTYDPVATSYSIKDLINNKNPQILNHSSSIKSASSISSSSTYKPSTGYARKSSLEQNPQLKSYLNKMATSQRSKSPSMLSTTSTSSSKYSSGRKTPNSRIGTHYAESTASSTSSSSKIYSKYKTPTSTSSSSISKIGTGASSYLDSEHKSKLSSSYGKSMYSSVGHTEIPTSSKISYSGRLSKTPTPSNYSNYSKSSNDSRIPSPSPYSKRSITPYY